MDIDWEEKKEKNQDTNNVYVVAFYINILQLYLEIIKLSVIIEYSTIKKEEVYVYKKHFFRRKQRLNWQIKIF